MRIAHRSIPVLLVAAIPLMFVALWAALLYAPNEKIMGPVQRIFYFHVPSAMVTYFSVYVLVGASMA